MPSSQEISFASCDVAAIVTAMTDGEKHFLRETVEAVMSDAAIGQVVLCVENSNNWIQQTLGSLSKDSKLEIIRLPMAFLGEVRNQALEYVRLPWVAYCGYQLKPKNRLRIRISAKVL